MGTFRFPGLFLGTLLLIVGSVPSLSAAGFRPLVQADPGESARLVPILKAVGRYCEKIKSAALNFVCLEKITDKEYFFRFPKAAPSGMKREERRFNIRRINLKTYEYDYQLIKKGGQIAESRILLKEDGRAKNEKNARLKNIESSSQFIIYGPVGFLSFYWQGRFNYSIIGEDVIDGLPAVVIQAVPKEQREDNYQIGRVWIGPKFQVLRLELEPAFLKDYEDEVLASPIGDFHKRMIWTIDFSVEKNGIRFPGRQRIQKLFVRENDDHVEQKALKRETLFEYIEYKFFTVGTEIVY